MKNKAKEKGAPEGKTGTRLQGVIEIGSTAIRLLVVQIFPDNSWETVDKAGLAIPLGRDVFSDGNISRESLLQCLFILNRFREVMDNWGIPDGQITVVATSAIREAKNRDSVLDRIAVKTGFRVRVIDGIEEIHLLYLVVSNALKNSHTHRSKVNSLIMDVGGGSTEILLLKNGKMVATHSFSIGTVVIDQQMKAFKGTMQDMNRLLEEYAKTTAEKLNNELRLDLIKELIAIGSDIRLAAHSVGVQADEYHAKIKRADFVNFVEKIAGLSPEEIVHRYGISYNEAESLLPGLSIYQFFLNRIGGDDILVPYQSIREGVILSILNETEEPSYSNFYDQTVSSAMTLAEKFHCDKKHAAYVTRMALFLFDSLQGELGLNRRARMLLEISAILHDIGSFIGETMHHLHGEYIVLHSEIFGLSREDLCLVANIVRYHRGDHPAQDHPGYASLPRDDRTMILKLSALLRIADALDCRHSQHIPEYTVELTPETLFLHPVGAHDTTMEKFALEKKGGLFEQVFGYTLTIVR